MKDIIVTFKNSFHLKYLYEIFTDKIAWWLILRFFISQGWVEVQIKQEANETRLIVSSLLKLVGHKGARFTLKDAIKFQCTYYFLLTHVPPLDADSNVQLGLRFLRGKPRVPSNFLGRVFRENGNTSKAFYIKLETSLFDQPFRRFYCTIISNLFEVLL